ncbi:MAG: 2-oxoacid:acceptor oxidoreductase subunit alpha [Hyphomicrobiales bacterium]
MNIHPHKSDRATTQARGVTVRFAGDSGDGVQVLGGEFAKSSALSGHDLFTFPDFPAEIRAPVGTTFGVSAFQIQFGGPKVLTPGDAIDVLIAFNPAALKTNLASLRKGGLLIVDRGAFSERNLSKAGYNANPLEDGNLADYNLQQIDITRLTGEAVTETGVSKKEADRSKNFWALGLTYWMFDRDRDPTISWLNTKFAKLHNIADANVAALNAGHAFGETMEMGADLAKDASSGTFAAGDYRTVTGIEAMANGLAAVAVTSGLKLVYCSYPITPASGLLHALAKLKGKGVVTFQAEDEIAAASAAVGVSYGGGLGITGSSGPGFALKSEAMSLAVATELPMIIVDVQRAGPSTGMPTKTEQADLMMALYGRHGEAPCPIIAPATPSECYQAMLDAAKIAITHMTPVIVLADGYVGNASEPWLIPGIDELPELDVKFAEQPEGFEPFGRDSETLARPWVRPGTPDLEHRIGGIERASGSGHISYDPNNHQAMTDLRAKKVARVSETMPALTVEQGNTTGEIAIVGWGSTFGAISSATHELLDEGIDAAHIHLRQLNPFPNGLEELLRGYRHVMIAEMNSGQLIKLIRAEYLIPAQGLDQISGQPFKVSTIKDAAKALLEN